MTAKLSQPWPQRMLSGSVIEVYYCLTMRTSHAREISVKFLFVLQELCAMYSCELSIVSHLRRDGMAEITVRTTLQQELVSALIANTKQLFPDFTATVTNVPLLQPMTINDAMQAHWNLRVNHGH